MKKWLTTLVLLAAALFSLDAQENPYGIDQECHNLLEEVMHLEGKIGFDSANSELLSKAIEKGDTKAQTIYYVEILKRVSHEAQYKRNKDISSWDSGMWNSKVEEARETAQRISKATGNSASIEKDIRSLYYRQQMGF
ncbi:MAG: hypothetical protein K6E61_04350 [Bacteroidales bacterium]|nr:hypothetical protein [Bacteroidales bacterium]